jgi:integrase/recombinase XerD
MLECEDISQGDKDAIAEFLDAIDPEQLTQTFVNADGETEMKSTNTLRTYVYGLKRVGEVADFSLREATTDDIKDVDPQAGKTGVYYLNTDAEGLKGAEQNGAKRPLLGAKRPVQDWLDFHPESDDPEAYLITPRQDHAWATTGEQLSQSTIRKTLKKLADEAGVDKPPNPHNFRHYFVTMCKRHYDMDNETIKHLIGHGEGSQVMETTYSHLTDEDKNKDAEVSFGVGEEEDTSPFTPPVCPTCGDNLAPDAKACGGCGTVFAPNAKAAQDQLQQQAEEKVVEVDNEQEAEIVKAVLKDLRENPQEFLDE